MFQKTAASLFSLLFLVIFLPSVLVINLNQTFLEKSFVAEKVVPAFYTVGEQIIVPKIYTHLEKQGFHAITEERVTQHFNDEIERSLFTDMVSSFYDQLTNFQNADKPDIVVSFEPLSSSLFDFGEKIVNDVLIETKPKDENVGVYRTTYKREILSALRTEFDTYLPREVIISNKQEEAEFLRKVSNYLEYKKIVSLTLIAVNVVFLGLIALSIFKPSHTIFKWLSVTLFLASFEVLLLNIFSSKFLEVVKKKIVVDTEDIPIIHGLVDNLYNSFITNVNHIGIYVLIVAFVFLILFALLRRKAVSRFTPES